MDKAKSAAKLGVDRRRYSRFDVQWPVAYGVADDVVVGVAENVSRGGMLVVSGPLPPAGHELEFALRNRGGQPLRVLGRICSQGAAGVHVKFVAVDGGTLEEAIEREVMPNLLGGLSGAAGDADTVRLVSSWYRELGREERALQVLRSLAAGARSPEPYEELAQLLLTRSKRLQLSGGFELLQEARQVIGQGLKIAASPVLVRLYQEGVRVGERLQLLQQQEHARQPRDATIPGEPIPVDDPQRPTAPDQGRRPGYLPPVVAGGRQAGLEPSSGAKAIDGAAFLPVPESRMTVVTRVFQTRSRWRWPAVGVLLLGGGLGLVFALQSPKSSTVESRVESRLEVAPALSALPMDEQRYEDLLDLEPELLARPPENDTKKPRRGKRRGRKAHRPAATLDDPSVATVKPPVTEVDRLASAKAHLKERKVLLAIGELEELVADQPRHADAFRILGVAYSLAGREDRAIAAFRRHIELEPESKHAAKMRYIIEKYNKP